MLLYEICFQHKGEKFPASDAAYKSVNCKLKYRSEFLKHFEDWPNAYYSNQPS